MRVAFDDIDDLPDGPGVYVVWSLLGGTLALAWRERERPLYVGMTKRDVYTRMKEHMEDADDAVPFLTSATCIDYYPCQNGRHARALERELQEELNPYYGAG